MNRAMNVSLLVAIVITGGCANQSPQTEAAANSAPVVATQSSGLTETTASAVESSEPREITFDAIKFEIGKGQPFNRELLTPEIEGLFGKRIRISGYMHPYSMLKQTAERFILIRDNQDGCYPFPQTCPIHDLIDVRMHPGKVAKWSINKIEVEGVLAFEEVRVTSDELTVAIYRLEDAVVR
ncbi:MAG: hypothetical protein AB7O68_17855 [Pirellulales bacterium]